MKKESKNTNIEQEPVVDSMTQLVFKEGKKLAESDFAKFSAIVATIFSAGLWGIKSIWYAYWSGIFSVYKIDKSYINVDNENIFLQIIQLGSILVVCFFLNYMYYKVSVAEDKSKFHWRRKRNILLFWLAEMIGLFVIVLFSSHARLWDLFNEFSVQGIIVFIFVLFVFCVMINIYAIELLIEEWWKRRKAKKVNEQQESDNKIKKKWQIKDVILSVLITLAVELLVTFFVTKYSEENRCYYKVIVIQNTEESESKFDIEIENNNSTYRIYPVAYENQDCYILTRLYFEHGEIKIDYDYQRIVEKEGQEIIYVNNIYEIGNYN